MAGVLPDDAGGCCGSSATQDASPRTHLYMNALDESVSWPAAVGGDGEAFGRIYDSHHGQGARPLSPAEPLTSDGRTRSAARSSPMASDRPPSCAHRAHAIPGKSIEPARRRGRRSSATCPSRTPTSGLKTWAGFSESKAAASPLRRNRQPLFQG